MSVSRMLTGRDRLDRWPHIRCAAAYEEWADFYEWHLEQRTAELADDPGLDRLVGRGLAR